MWFIFACTSGTYDVSYTTQREQTDTSAEEVEDSGVEIEEEPSFSSDLFCPDNMVSVRDEWEDPVYCIDRFEISVYGTELGNADQGLDWPDASTTALAISEVGVVPEMYISWYQAYALCQNSGKYLCSHSEWEDGCDGHYGGGGYKYPYGDQWFEGWCAARLGEVPQVYDAAQETGKHDQCECVWGTFDQIG
ncbi:MAG: hypothetical protein VX278_00060, partial [Myxococcota bacterium]|nr:hypothetical protein [Myxococcota bacterium]